MLIAYFYRIGIGPLFFAPISEVYGRRIGVIVPAAISGIFSIGCGAANNFATILIMRFFQGFFGGAPIANTGGMLGDIWRPDSRAVALVLYSFFVTGAPPLGSIIGASFSLLGKHGWRWSQYFIGIFTLVTFVFAFLTIPETYHPVLLARKAKSLRMSTGNWAYHAQHEEWEFTLKEMITKHFMRPFAMLMTPIVTCMSVYGSFVYGILYVGVIAIPYTFADLRGWGKLISSLPSIAILLGITFGGVLNIIGSMRYAKLLAKRNGVPVPEDRLFMMQMGSFFLPAGLFIFGWTSSPECHWIAPVLGLIILSMGFMTVFQGSINYLVDAFPRYGASAIAATTFLRSCMAAGFPIFSKVMFKNLGLGWGASIMGFVGVAMLPIPFILIAYGARLRSRNPYASRIE